MKLADLSSLFVVALALGGCQAYANAANGVLNSGMVKVTDGSVKVKNGLSVSVCKITVVPEKEPGRSANDMHGAGKPLLPGADGMFDLPHFGKAEEATPEGTKYSLKVYACDDKSTIHHEPGALVTTLSIDPKQTKEIVIH